MYEVFSISGHYVLHDGSKSLWCSKLDGKLVPSNCTVLDDSLEPVCLGTCHGIVGKIKFLPESPGNLVLITDVHFVCRHNGMKVHRIDSIVMLPLSLETPYLDLPTCLSHPKPPRGENTADTDAKIERKLEDEFVKWFEKSFYYTEQGGDLTHNLSQLSALDTGHLPSWQRAKTEYFWNEDMLECLIAVHPHFPGVCDAWIVPIMQGYIEQAPVPLFDGQHSTCDVTPRYHDVSNGETTKIGCVRDELGAATLTIISRRSKYRAGTRFKRRGIDNNGCPANYVETEQILTFGKQQLSYNLIRGSVPVYWYQPLTNYRPKPVILRTPEEALLAFQLHMDKLISSHKRVVIVNLLDSFGKEAPLGDEFAKVAYMYNNENLTYIAFDFNEYCAGMKFDNVGVLLKELSSTTSNFGFTHVVDNQVLARQEGAIRVNCMDSLDRTNVVQGAIARQCLFNQAVALNLPCDAMSAPAKLLWANNGDAISTQYAGTAALKGDYTRTGERGVAGMMRDGVSSMTRMYINVFRDTNRQAAIDIMQGLEPDLADIRDDKSEELDCIPALMEAGSALLPSPADSTVHNIFRSWITQEWPSGEATAVWLTAKSLSIVHTRDQLETISLANCDRIHIGQPTDCQGHYLRLTCGKVTYILRPLTLETHQLKDVLMKMAHCIVSSRDDLGLTTQVLHGPLTKPDTLDLGIDKIKCSANSFGTRIAAGAKRMIGEARGVLDTTRSVDSGVGSSPGGSSPRHIGTNVGSSPRSSPKFGRKMLSIFKREEVGSSVSTVRLSDLAIRQNTLRLAENTQPENTRPGITQPEEKNSLLDVDAAPSPNHMTSTSDRSFPENESRDEGFAETRGEDYRGEQGKTLLQIRDDNIAAKQIIDNKSPPPQEDEPVITLLHYSSETELDKLPREDRSATLRKSRAATFDTMHSFVNSKSNFIFIDRLPEDI